MKWISGIVAVSALAGVAAAQQPDTTRQPIVLPPVQITGSIAPVAGPSVASGIPATVTTIGGAQLSAWKPRLVTDALTSLPGVASTDDLGSPKKVTLELRGFSVGPTVGNPAGLSVFLDGVRQNEPDAQEVNFDLLPIDAVDRVEVLTGPASLLGPNGLGGAINLITKRGGGPPGGTLEIGVGSFGQAEATVSSSGRAGSWDYYGLAGADRADGWRAASTERGSHALLNLSQADDARGVSVQGYVSQSRAGTAGSLPESMFDLSPRTNFTAGDADDIDAQQLRASGFASIASGQGTITAFVRRSYADRFNANQVPDPNVRGLTDDVTEGASADWRRSLKVWRASLDVRGGVDASLDQVHVRLFDIDQDPSSSPDSLATDVVSHRLTLAAYMIADVVARRLTLSAGLRADHIDSPFDDRLDPTDSSRATYRSVTPRAGVSLDLGHGATAYASLGTSFRAPALVESGCADPTAACPLPFALGDDPPLAPVRATSYEAGGRWLLGSTLLRTSVYRSDVRNEIVFVASPASIIAGYFTNVPQTRREGAEFEASGPVASRVTWNASYAVSRATFESPVQLFSVRSDDDVQDSPLAGPNQVQPGDEMPLIPNSLFKAGADLRIGRGATAGFDVRRVGSQWLRGDEANQTSQLSPYTVADARIGLDRDRWGMSLVVRNMFDSHAPFFGTFNINRTTGKLERFLTPLDARSVRLTVHRSLGAGGAPD